MRINQHPSHKPIKSAAMFDNPSNVKRLLRGLYILCILLLVLDFVIHRHVVHQWENLPGFYPLYGFIACVILVRVATWMRTFLIRPEDYYERQHRSWYSQDKAKQGESQSPIDSGEQNVDS